MIRGHYKGGGKPTCAEVAQLPRSAKWGKDDGSRSHGVKGHVTRGPSKPLRQTLGLYQKFLKSVGLILPATQPKVILLTALDYTPHILPACESCNIPTGSEPFMILPLPLQAIIWLPVGRQSRN